MSTRWVGKLFAAAFLLMLPTARLKSEPPEAQQFWEVVISWNRAEMWSSMVILDVQEMRR